jgi:hypothetical protein
VIIESVSSPADVKAPGVTILSANLLSITAGPRFHYAGQILTRRQFRISARDCIKPPVNLSLRPEVEKTGHLIRNGYKSAKFRNTSLRHSQYQDQKS